MYVLQTSTWVTLDKRLLIGKTLHQIPPLLSNAPHTTSFQHNLIQKSPRRMCAILESTLPSILSFSASKWAQHLLKILFFRWPLVVHLVTSLHWWKEECLGVAAVVRSKPESAVRQAGVELLLKGIVLINISALNCLHLQQGISLVLLYFMRTCSLNPCDANIIQTLAW